MYQGNLGTVSNRADWADDAVLVDDATGDPIDLTGASIALYVTAQNTPDAAIITASTANGMITITGAGAFGWTVPDEMMAPLCAGTYSVFIRVTRGDAVDQLAAGDLSVIHGGPAS